MTKREALRQSHQLDTLRSLGFTTDEAEALRRISLTLRRWFELECGDSRGQHSWAIERDDNGDGPPFMVTHYYPTNQPTRTIRRRIADRETGARKRLAAILKARNERVNAEQMVCPNCQQWQTSDCCHECVKRGFAPSRNVSAYVQTDPRGAALYIIRPGDVPDGQDVRSYYSRGICVY